VLWLRSRSVRNVAVRVRRGGFERYRVSAGRGSFCFRISGMGVGKWVAGMGAGE